MKKSYLLLAATLLTACTNTDTFREVISQEDSEEAISFTSYTQKATRAENTNNSTYDLIFYNHHESFRVWAYKATSTNPVFRGTDDEVVSVTRSGSEGNYTYAYSYTEKHFWDKSQAAIYNFYAAAPEAGGNSSEGTNGAWVFENAKITSTSTQNLGYFKTTSKLSGTNLKDGTTIDRNPSTTLTNVFKNETDVDKMIAEPCSGNYDSFLSGTQHIVSLNFIHILSKLNVTVKKDATVLADKEVKLNGIQIVGLSSTGNFAESTNDATTSSNADKTGSHACWSGWSGSVTYGYSNSDGIELNGTSATEKLYFIESLVIPQTAEQQAVRYDGGIIELYEDYSAYNQGHASDENFVAISSNDFANLTDAQKMKPVTKNVTTSDEAKPYLVISYTIDGEPFVSYHNLATAFQTAVNGTTLDFYEGYQNTLNINICPEEIKFSANVAEWDNKTANPDPSSLD